MRGHSKSWSPHWPNTATYPHYHYGTRYRVLGILFGAASRKARLHMRGLGAAQYYISALSKPSLPQCPSRPARLNNFCWLSLTRCLMVRLPRRACQVGLRVWGGELSLDNYLHLQCIYTHLHKHIHLCSHVHLRIHLQAYTHIQLHMPSHITLTYKCAFTLYIYSYTYLYVRVHVHMHLHKNMHKQMHMPTQVHVHLQVHTPIYIYIYRGCRSQVYTDAGTGSFTCTYT